MASQRIKPPDSTRQRQETMTTINEDLPRTARQDDGLLPVCQDEKLCNQLPVKTDQQDPVFMASTNGTASNNPQAKDEEVYLKPNALIIVMIALLLACLLMALDMSIVSTAIPRITDDFDTLADIGWYGSAYLLTCAALQPLTGKFYTYLSLKTAFFIFIAFFEAGSVVAGAATSSKMLVIGRAVSGLGGAGLMNGCLTIIGVSAPAKQRPMLMGIIMAFFGTGQMIGPLIGGALTQHASWRWCFYLNLPVGAATCVCLLFIHIPGHKRETMQWDISCIVRSFDLIGFCLFAPAAIMVLLGLQWGGVEYSWSSATIVGLLCGSTGTFAAFGYWEHRAGENALMPMSMIRRRVIWASVLMSGFQGGGIIMLGYYLPLYFQVVRNADPMASALRILPLMIAQVVFAMMSGAFVAKVGYLAPPAFVGSLFAIIGSALLITFDTTTPPSQWIGYQVILGAGRGLAIQIPILVVQASTTSNLLPTGTAIVSWSQFFGGALFLGVGQAVLQGLLRTGLRMYAPTLDPQIVLDAGATNYRSATPISELAHVEEAYAWAISRTFALAVAATGAAFLMSLGIGWKTSAKTKEHDERGGESSGERESGCIRLPGSLTNNAR